MKISGFTFVRNGIDLGYPFRESIRSLLPLCDEIIVNVPNSTDDTLAAVRGIGDARIKIIECAWDATPKPGGKILSHHTNLALEQCTGDWCVYIQGDEVLHESSIPSMRQAMESALPDQQVQGLLVDYTHFYGSFWTYTYSFGWYYKEIRIVRRDPNIVSVGDAQGFRTRTGEKLWVRNSGGKYFHYGFALEPGQMSKRKSSLTSLYQKKEALANPQPTRPVRSYDKDQKVKRFTGTHPNVMKDLVAAADWTYESSSPLIRLRRNYFWEDIALLIKQCTGITLGVHKNYRLLR